MQLSSNATHELTRMTKKPSVFECILLYEKVKWIEVFAGVVETTSQCAFRTVAILHFCTFCRCCRGCYSSSIVNEMWCHQRNWDDFIVNWIAVLKFTLLDAIVWLVGFRPCCMHIVVYVLHSIFSRWAKLIELCPTKVRSFIYSCSPRFTKVYIFHRSVNYAPDFAVTSRSIDVKN